MAETDISSSDEFENGLYIYQDMQSIEHLLRWCIIFKSRTHPY